MRTLTVSRTTARFVADGHPWVRPDRFTRGLETLQTGEPVTLIDKNGKHLASALANPANEVCARVYHRRPDMPFVPAQALTRAWDKRAALHANPDTDCYRVVHGEGDFLPGLRVERYASVFVVLVLADCATPYVDEICRSLQRRMPEAIVVRRDHRSNLRREDVTSRRFGGDELDPETLVIGKELGVQYPLRPVAGLATGIYVDQRSTRAWLMPQVAGNRVLNLFAYTGAFSLALLKAGAASARDVDLAGPALARAAEAAVLNGVAARHSIHQGDCRKYLTGTTDSFDLIICDPPTAAQGGDGWILRRDYPEVLRAACARLAPGGMLVACCNTLGGKPFPLMEVVSEAARSASIMTSDVSIPPLGEDLPSLSGFPEGRPYRLVAVKRR
ncbi:MAG TPA: class I SAM-dependent methyltransferase [Planctomycetota bacterium]|nr:class I SAM-dependent methyltransferase [Planctomycetota bacterium]